VDVSTVIAATAALWAAGFAWFTYVMAVRTQNEDEFVALKGIVEGLRVELSIMESWIGPGYSKNMELKDAPSDWSHPRRLIYKFNAEAIANLSRSPYLYRLRELVGPFAILNLSVSKIFQIYDEYRNFVNSHPEQDAAVSGTGASTAYDTTVLNFNFLMHVKLIGGPDGAADCLYKTYNTAVSVLDNFDKNLQKTPLAWWFLIGHMLSSAFAVFGIFLLVRLFQS